MKRGWVRSPLLFSTATGLLWVACFAWAVVGAQAPSQLRAKSTSNATAAPAAVIEQYCLSCHNGRTRSGGLSLTDVDVLQAGGHAETWEKVLRKLRARTMPPPGRPRPDEASYVGLKTSIEAELDRAALLSPNPGRTETFHRLNRTEYQNVIRDLLALDIDAASLLPADDASYGFDNIAGVLRVNQTSMERNLSAARKVSRLAIASTAPPPASETFPISPELPQYDRIDGLPLGTRGGTRIRYNFPYDGEYEFVVTLMCINTRGGDENCADGSSGFPDPQQLEVSIDGAPLHVFSFDPTPRHERYTDVGVVGSTYAENERLQVRAPITSGPHEVVVTFLRQPAAETIQRTYRLTFDKPLNYRGVDRSMQITMPHVSKVTISGPFAPAGIGDTPSRRAIFVCRPEKAQSEAACANTIVTRLAKLAYRRPATSADVRELLNFYDDARSKGESFDAGIEYALRALLVSPKFWFRVESDPANLPAGAVYRLDDLELASRLSFFLWSSIPDEELLDLAAKGQLKRPAVLDRQVRRMLADERATALTVNFAAQWLGLRRLATVAPNESTFPDFDESLRQAFTKETELFIDSIRRDNRSVTDMLDADYTFVNARLARHYGIPNVQGSHFRRVPLATENPHRGLLGQGSVLTITSHPTRTSPVKRGKWILDNILGTPPPAPPPNVPELKENKGDGRVLSVRDRMAKHREDPYCGGCHAAIDPMGFALENFDAVGRFRTLDQETGAPVDASGSLADGTSFTNVAEFRAGLVRHPQGFVTTLTEKLLTYALGRGLEYYDMPAVRTIVRDAGREQYRFAALIGGVVKSVPFQMRTSAATPARSSLTNSQP